MSTVLVDKLEQWRQRVEYQGLMLGVLCALVTITLLFTEQKTSQPIAERLAEDRLANLMQVMPSAYYDNDPLQNTTIISDTEYSKRPIEVFIGKKNGFVNALAFEFYVDGYGGPITLLMGVEPNGEIIGLRVVAHKETPGLADKIELDKSEWILSFDGKSLSNTAQKQWAVKKDGGQFDQFSGATITPRAIVGGVYKYLGFFEKHSSQLLDNGEQVFAESHKPVSSEEVLQ